MTDILTAILLWISPPDPTPIPDPVPASGGIPIHQ